METGEERGLKKLKLNVNVIDGLGVKCQLKRLHGLFVYTRHVTTAQPIKISPRLLNISKSRGLN